MKTKPSKKTAAKKPAKEENKGIKSNILNPAEKIKHPGGRPPKFKTPQEMQTSIDDYFESCWYEKVTEHTDKDTGNVEMSVVRYQQRPYTIAGLALSLDMDTETLRLYGKNEQFFAIVKKAKQKIEMNFEELLAGKNPTGSIFWLKNHAGYVDRQIQEHDISEGLAAELKAARKRAGL